MAGKLKIVILTEGGKDIGMGHITRCASLCQAFEEKGITPEFVVNGEDVVGEPVSVSGRGNAIYNWLNDRDRLLSRLAGSDIAVIDSYLADGDLYKMMAKYVRLPVYVDDYKRLPYPHGVVLNGSINAEALDYPSEEGIEYLLGIRYIPLRKEFWSVAEKDIREEIGSIMVTMGGDDMRNKTPDILRALTEHYPETVKKIIVGKGFKNRGEIDLLKDKKTELVIHPDAGGMKQVMLESDLAISAGGQTLYELARVGVPTIAITAADNQLSNMEGWEREGFITNAGRWDDRNVLDNIIRSISLLGDREIRQKKSKIGKSTVDGRGAARVAAYCLRKSLRDTCIIRPAGINDMHTVYELSNEKEARQNSFNQENIKFEDHKKWFLQKIADPDCLLLVAEANNSIIGQARFDMSGDEAVVSISIYKGYRGSGIGTDVLQKALAFLKSSGRRIRAVNAYVKGGNASSVRLFEKSGFKFVREFTIKEQNAVHYAYYY